MEQAFISGYIILSVIMVLIDFFIMVKSFETKKRTGFYLGICCVMAAAVDLSYLGSILETDYMRMSVMASIYFVSIDYALVNLVMFMTSFITLKPWNDSSKRLLAFLQEERRKKWLKYLMIGYAIFDTAMFAINPFCEVVLGYAHRDTMIASYTYQWKPLYAMHIGYAYLLVAVAVVRLILKWYQAPAEYRSPYTFMVMGIMGIVLINAMFLLVPYQGIWNLLDYSMCGYSITVIVLYWSCFDYATHGMLNRLKTRVFENLDQGLILFDYEENLILSTQRAVDLLGGEALPDELNFTEFMRHYQIYLENAAQEENNVLQFFVKNNDEMRPIMCDSRTLKSKNNQILGHLLTLSDMTLEMDTLTGFQSWKSFKQLQKDKESSFSLPAAVGICDVSGLSEINSTLGKEAGDQKIRELSELMKKYCPKQTYFVRGSEAYLIAIRSGMNSIKMEECLRKAGEQFSGNIQYAVDRATAEEPDIMEAVLRAMKSMQTKKILDQNSMHSEALNALMCALQESDSDTEQHVHRTRLLGEKLGRRIELNDYQLSQLSLLCLLHDIGKIGIPLDILNKAGKLSKEEWEVLKTHTLKGYEIARSNKAFEGIADEILHHHERWDGEGYPDGLSQESIPILSRVIAVVDAYDAMVSDRVYRKARSKSEALKELKKCAGTQFDPYIVSELLIILKEEFGDEAETQTSEQASPEYSIMESKEEAAKADAQNVHVLESTRYRLDSAFHILEVDDNFEKMTGYTWEDVQKNHMVQVDLIPEMDRTDYLRLVNLQHAKDQSAYMEHRIRRKDGREIFVLCYGRWFFYTPLREDRIEILLTSVSNTYYMQRLADLENNKAQQRLKYWEKTYRQDSLTGLLTHGAFRNDVEIKLLEGHGKILMLMMDLDKFKNYNDTYGHRAGDEYLILTAHTLVSVLRKEDSACRMGGDEFAAALFFAENTDEQMIRDRAQQIYDKLTLILSTSPGGAGVSMGAVIASSGEENTFNDLYEKMDKALYESKEQGRGRLTIR